MSRIIPFLICSFFVSEMEAQSRVKHKKEPVILSFLQFSLSTYKSDLFPGQYSIRVNDDLWNDAQGKSYNLEFGIALTKKADLITGISLNNFFVTQVKGFGYAYCDPTLYHATEVISTNRYLHLQSLDWPVEARYKFHVKKFSINPALGFRTMYYLAKEADIDVLLDTKQIVHHSQNAEIRQEKGSFNLAPFVKLGMDYKFSKKLKLNADVFYRYTLGKIDFFNQILNEYETVNIGSLGASIGLAYALKMSKR